MQSTPNLHRDHTPRDLASVRFQKSTEQKLVAGVSAEAAKSNAKMISLIDKLNKEASNRPVSPELALLKTKQDILLQNGNPSALVMRKQLQTTLKVIDSYQKYMRVGNCQPQVLDEDGVVQFTKRETKTDQDRDEREKAQRLKKRLQYYIFSRSVMTENDEESQKRIGLIPEFRSPDFKDTTELNRGIRVRAQTSQLLKRAKSAIEISRPETAAELRAEQAWRRDDKIKQTLMKHDDILEVKEMKSKLDLHRKHVLSNVYKDAIDVERYKAKKKNEPASGFAAIAAVAFFAKLAVQTGELPVWPAKNIRARGVSEQVSIAASAAVKHFISEKKQQEHSRWFGTKNVFNTNGENNKISNQLNDIHEENSSHHYHSTALETNHYANIVEVNKTNISILAEDSDLLEQHGKIAIDDTIKAISENATHNNNLNNSKVILEGRTRAKTTLSPSLQHLQQTNQFNQSIVNGGDGSNRDEKASVLNVSGVVNLNSSFLKNDFPADIIKQNLTNSTELNHSSTTELKHKHTNFYSSQLMKSKSSSYIPATLTTENNDQLEVMRKSPIHRDRFNSRIIPTWHLTSQPRPTSSVSRSASSSQIISNENNNTISSLFYLPPKARLVLDQHWPIHPPYVDPSKPTPTPKSCANPPVSPSKITRPFFSWSRAPSRGLDRPDRLSPFSRANGREVLPYGIGFASTVDVPANVRERRALGDTNRVTTMLKGKSNGNSYAEMVIKLSEARMRDSTPSISKTPDSPKQRNIELPCKWSMKADLDVYPLTADKLQKVKLEKKRDKALSGYRRSSQVTGANHLVSSTKINNGEVKSQGAALSEDSMSKFLKKIDVTAALKRSSNILNKENSTARTENSDAANPEEVEDFIQIISA